MAARSTSRFKQKPAVPFGDFMLPILGVIALGIVVVGIRILWAPSVPKPAIIAQPRSVQRAQKNSAPVATTVSNTQSSNAQSSEDDSRVSKKETLKDVPIAQPVKKNTQRQAEERKPAPEKSASSNAAANAQAAAQKPKSEPKRPEPAKTAEKKALPRVTIDSSSHVVQCGSYTTRNAANSVVESLKRSRYNPVIRKAEVNGKTYFRVIVAGGTKEQADEVAKAIKAEGYPVFVRPKD